MAASNKATLIGVDTNVLYHLAEEDDDTIDALAVIRSRAPNPDFRIPPTVGHELAHEIKRKGPAEKQALIVAQNSVPVWKFRPENLSGVPNGIAESIAKDLIEEALIPEEEKNDSLIVGEAVVMKIDILLTNDEHLLGIDRERANHIVKQYGYTLPVIAKPRRIAQMFFK